jgi:DNA polymerase III subunit gamma/tau
LLKLVEEPPPHVKFIFATTEPDKVISTIRSRTHHYPFRLVPPRVLTDYLAKLCAAEGIQVEPGVLPLVVRSGAGSVRDSLSVLDQLLGGAEDSGVSYQHAASLLGYTPDSLLDELVDAFAAGDAGGVFTSLDKVIEVGQDPRRFAEDLLRRLRDLVLVAAVPDALTSGLVEVAPDQTERLASHAAALGPGELTRAAEVIATGLTEMRGTTAPRLHLELMCARVLLPGADVDDRGIHARLDRLERRLGVVGSAAPDESRSAATKSSSATSSVPTSPELAPPSERRPSTRNVRESQGSTPTVPETLSSEPAAPSFEPAAPSFEPAEESSTGSSAERSTNSAPEADPEASRKPTRVAGQESSTPTADDSTSSGRPAQLSVTDVRRLWPEVLEEVKGKRRFTWILLSQNAQVADVRDGTLTLAMANAGARDSFGRGGSEDILREALIVVLGVDFRIVTMVDVSAAPTASVPRAGTGWSEPSGQDAATGQQARQQIRTTRTASSAGDSNGGVELVDARDAEADRTDADLDDSTVSDTDLLARHLGAEIIAEEEHGA